MAEASEKKAPDEPEMPPEVARVKAKLEASTGKTYTYRPKEAVPSIQNMLIHGPPDEEGRPKTWVERSRGPALLALLFCATFFLYVQFAPTSLSTLGVEVSPETMNGLSIKERMRVIQQRREDVRRMRQEKEQKKGPSSFGSEL